MKKNICLSLPPTSTTIFFPPIKMRFFFFDKGERRNILNFFFALFVDFSCGKYGLNRYFDIAITRALSDGCVLKQPTAFLLSQ